MKKKSILLLPFLVFGMSLAACKGKNDNNQQQEDQQQEEEKKDDQQGGGDQQGGDDQQQTIAVSGVSVSPTSLSLKVGETGTLTATVTPSNATDKTVTWSTSDATVASVNGGAVKAEGVGSASITAKAGDKTATCVVTVEEDEPVVPPTPAKVYAAKIGDQDLELIKVTADETAGADVLEQYHAVATNLQAGEEISFTADGAAIAFLADSGSNSKLEGGKYVVNNDVSAADLYFKVHEGESYSFWLSGYEEEMNYQVQFGSNAALDMIPAQKDEFDPANCVAKFMAQADVVAGQSIKFTLNGEAILPGDERTEENPNNGNNTSGEYPNYVVHNDKADAEVYLKVYDNGEAGIGYSFWLTGYQGEPVPEKAYTVKLGDAEPVALAKVDVDPNTDGTAVAKYKGTTDVVKGGLVLFFVDGESADPVPGADKGDAENHNNVTGEWPTFYIHNDAENADVYLKLYGDGGFSFWITGWEEGEDPIPAEKAYTVKFGDGEPVALTQVDLDPGTDGEAVAKFKGTADVAKGATISFLEDGVAIAQAPGADGGDETNHNNVSGEWPNYLVHNAAAGADIYLKRYSNGGFSFWITGWEEGEPEPTPEEHTLKVQIDLSFAADYSPALTNPNLYGWNDKGPLFPWDDDDKAIKLTQVGESSVYEADVIYTGELKGLIFRFNQEGEPTKQSVNLETEFEAGKTYIISTAGEYAVAPDVTPERWDLQATIAERVGVASVALNKDELELIVGASETLEATVLPANATNKAVTWSVVEGGEGFVSVDKNGKVTALAAGEAQVKVASQEDPTKTALCAVTVSAAPAVTGIEATYSGEHIYVGDKLDGTLLTVKKVYEGGAKLELSEEEYGQLHFFADSLFEHEIEDAPNYVFKEADKALNTIYVKFGTFEGSFAVSVVDKPVEVLNYVVIGDSTEKAELLEATDHAAGALATYYVEGVDLVKDAQLHVFFNKAEITEGIGPSGYDNDPHYSDPGHNVMNGVELSGDPEVLKLLLSKENASIYIDVYSDGYSVWTEGNPIHSYGLVGSSAQLGEWSPENAIAMTKEAVKGESAEVEVSLVKDEEFKVALDGKWDESYGYADLNTLEGDLAKAFVAKDGNILVKYGGDYKISINYSTKTITITGVVTDEIPVATDYNLTVVIDSSFEASYNDQTPDTYIYAFINATEYEWIKVGDDGKVVIPAKYTSFIVVRMNPDGEGKPNWDSKWNKTVDIAIDASKTTVTITGWIAETDLVQFTYTA